MQRIIDLTERRTTTEVVFGKLRDEIVSLKLLPGTKLSEADVARRFGVSRQPVRDAFNRLGSMDLLLIRPQRATEVRGFSLERIAHARFVRLAVELEVIRCACAVWGNAEAAVLEQNMDRQQQSLGQSDSFHSLDYHFHKLICEQGGCPMAFETIYECKQKIDRLCVLSLGKENEPLVLLEDHRELAQALRKRSVEAATSITRKHLSRLDEVISDIHGKHAEYFE